MNASITQLHHLANLYGIRTSYQDMDNRTRTASIPTLLAVLQAMGASVNKLEDVPSAIREKNQLYWQLPVDPVIVTWGSEGLTVNLRIPSSWINSMITATLSLENGEERRLDWRMDESLIISANMVEGCQYLSLRLCLPERLPYGYHQFRLGFPGNPTRSLVISAPMKAFSPARTKEKIWGTFLPLYALHSQRSWGAGDFGDLRSLMDWVAKQGGNMIGTLPLLSSFFDEQFGPGPYMPASRLFWNEFYLDIDQIPELGDCPAAQNIINSPEFQKEIGSLRSSHRVDYQRQLTLKRRVLEELCAHLFANHSKRFSALQSYIDTNKCVEDYAHFRAAGEKQGIDWRKWPDRMREGDIRKSDYAEQNAQYHLYTQWLVYEQIENLFQKAQRDNMYLYMDMPVGVHPYSYDVWREPESFVPGVYGGAPPDPVFTSGQNWNFPPIHPEKIRTQGYRYVIQSLQHQLKQTGMLRIDHMMNFHRLFWIPAGMEGRDGVYVNYRSEELYAILTLESLRNKSIIIGEDLGIVPPEVRPMMEKHNIYRMFVGQFELIAENQLGIIPARVVASLNTHDMYPFTAFWEEQDIAERQKLKLIDAATAQKELEQRRQIKRALISILQYRGIHNEISQDSRTTLFAVLKLISESQAYAFLVNLEDLWLEKHPQNVPGTRRKQNWSQKSAWSLEKFSKSPVILQTLREINRRRKGDCI